MLDYCLFEFSSGEVQALVALADPGDKSREHSGLGASSSITDILDLLLDDWSAGFQQTAEACLQAEPQKTIGPELGRKGDDRLLKRTSSRMKSSN